MAMQRRGIDVSRERGKNITPSLHSQSNSNHRYQLLEPLHGAVFSTIPLPHTIPVGAGVAASSCSLGSVAWPLPWVGVIVAFSELTFDFLLPVKHYSTGCNSRHTGPLEDVDSAISVFSLSLRSYAMRLLGLAGPVERAGFSKNILYSQSRGGSKVVSSDPILAKRPNDSYRPPKSSNLPRQSCTRTPITIVLSAAAAMVP